MEKTILHFTSLGYRLVDRVHALQEGVEFFHRFAGLLRPIPYAGKVARIIQRGLRGIRKFVDKVARAAGKLEASFLTPACNVGHAIGEGLEWFLNILEGTAFALDLAARPPSKLLREIVQNISLCSMLKFSAPVGDMAFRTGVCKDVCAFIAA